jgi:hypothetical protein
MEFQELVNNKEDFIGGYVDLDEPEGQTTWKIQDILIKDNLLCIKVEGGLEQITARTLINKLHPLSKNVVQLSIMYIGTAILSKRSSCFSH